MQVVSSYRSELIKLAKLTGPILVAQVTQTLMSVVDTLMAGQAGAVDLAAVSVGGSIWLPAILLMFGLALALAPVISHLHGANEQWRIANITQQGFYSCALGGLLAVATVLAAPLLLDVMDVEAQFRAVTLDYLGYIIWGLPALLIYVVLRNFCEGLSHTMPSLVISSIGLLVNIPANYIFIHGHFGVPAMGGAGCGLASAIVLWVMGLSMLLYVYSAKRFREIKLFSRIYWPNWDDVVYLIRLGFPIAMAIFFEVSLFAAVALLIAPLGPEVVSSHQIAMNISALVYMVPMSLSMAITLRVGFALGAGTPANAMRSYRLAMVLGMSFAAVNGIGMYLGGSWLAGLYTDNQAIIVLAAQLMGLAAIFTLSDTFQAINIGTLRGYKDTNMAMLITFVSYWPFGLSVGAILGLTDWLVPAMGAAGFWIGFITGLTCAAILLSWRLRYIVKHHRNSDHSLASEATVE
ncbi:MATE family efflux transporter [Idiomarina xiamenensis]|uniref:Multidrug-efflux transporter n=1 Tax=Idiomarina xiamenensis 10-D-4 TaxID=740709 RepID=K2K8C2_9GAMM|nr:Na+-driven multidrug efflux pump [Idiomarina xiamenensis 10-D-4]